MTEQGNYSIITDYLGTPIEAYDETGKKVWEQELDAYGRVRKRPVKKEWGRVVDDGMFDEHFINFRYQGQYADEELDGELYYNRFRYYSPELGQYITQDPIGLEGGNPTLYGYVFDPNSEIDIFGLLPTDPADRQLLEQILGQLKNSSGVYVFRTGNGQVYVGQAQDLYTRLLQHLQSGKLSPSNISSITIDPNSVGLSGQALNNAEAHQIARQGGLQNTANIRRPPHTGNIANQDLRK